METLVSHGADLNIQSLLGETCLHLAIKMALSRKVNSTNTLRRTTERYRHCNLSNEQALVIFLLEHGADPNILDQQMKSPIDYVQDNMFYQLILERIHELKQSAAKFPEQPTPKQVSVQKLSDFWILLCMSSVMIDHLWQRFGNQPLDDLQSRDHSTRARENEDTSTDSTPSTRDAHHVPRIEVSFIDFCAFWSLMCLRYIVYEARRTKARFDERGGELHIPSYGFTLSVPPGALEEGSTEEITLEVLTDIPTNIQLQDDEIVVSHGFQCYPSGLQFREPVTLLIPHCAVFDDTDDLEAALYSWESLEKETPVRYPHTAIDCMVSETHFILPLHHFSGGLLAILRKFVKGKLMSCMPYLPKTMPSTKEPVLEVRFVNKPRGMVWRDAHGYNPLDPSSSTRSAMDRDREVFVKRRNLQVSCQMANHQPESKNVEYWYFMHKTNHTVDFILDFHECQTYDRNITLTLAQGSRQEQIIFPTRFEDPLHVQPSPVLPTSSSPPGTEVNVNEVLEKEISDLAEDLGNDVKLRKLALELGFSYDKWELYSSSNIRRDGRVCWEGTFFMLMDWKKNTSTDSQRPKLIEALEETGLAELAEKYSGNLPANPSSE